MEITSERKVKIDSSFISISTGNRSISIVCVMRLCSANCHRSLSVSICRFDGSLSVGALTLTFIISVLLLNVIVLCPLFLSLDLSLNPAQ